VCVLLCKIRYLKCPPARIRARRRLRHSCIVSLIHFSASHTPDNSINVMNFRLVQPILHFFPHFIVTWVQIWTSESQRSYEIKVGVSHSTRLIVSQARYAGSLYSWKIKNSPETSRMTSSSCSVSNTSWYYAPLTLTHNFIRHQRQQQ